MKLKPPPVEPERSTMKLDVYPWPRPVRANNEKEAYDFGSADRKTLRQIVDEVARDLGVQPHIVWDLPIRVCQEYDGYSATLLYYELESDEELEHRIKCYENGLAMFEKKRLAQLEKEREKQEKKRLSEKKELARLAEKLGATIDWRK